MFAISFPSIANLADFEKLFRAAQALEFRRPARSSETLERLVAEYRKEVPFIDNDSVMYPHIESSIRFIRKS